MRRIWLPAVLCAAFLFSSAGPAQAQIWRWIYELSGPGPFTGLELEWRLVCFADESNSAGAAAVASDTNETSRWLGVLGPGCLFRPVRLDQERRASVNLAFGLLSAKDNNLLYADPGTDREVKLTSIEPTAWWRPLKSVEVGAGGGLFWFSGPAFESFHRVFLEPFRVDVKPVALVKQLMSKPTAEWMEAISFRAGFVIIPQSFRAQDFGAIPGTFQTSRENLPTFSVYIDWEPLIRHLRRRTPSPGQRP